MSPGLRAHQAVRSGLTPRQRRLLATKLADFGNVAAGSLLFGALLREEILTNLSIGLGLVLLVLAYVLALALIRKAQ
jgi:hypothetical protein